MEYGSLPAWECGLKSSRLKTASTVVIVTPCVGVWIEIGSAGLFSGGGLVTPCVGVWIEIDQSWALLKMVLCHSLRGSVD